ncbi:MAG: DMT family transporter [Lachnospiraceae bacterium]|nr:DMT family transporter [Lachnospiraceae bacterium]
MINKTALRQSLILFTAALIWGFTFVAQSVGMDYVGPFTFIAARNIVALFILLPMAVLMDRRGKKPQNRNLSDPKRGNRLLLSGGICCGIFLFLGSTLQQFGVRDTTVGKAGFISALYMVMVPVLGIFLGKKTTIRLWAAVALAAFGMYLLCMTKGDFHLQKGDLYLLACAAAFSFQILSVDRFSPLVDGIKLSCVQTLTNAVLGTVMMVLFERPDFGSILAAWMPIVYAGALSSGIGYTFQIIGQKDLNPTVASLIMSLESVISALAGWLLLKQTLSARELTGCALTFLAIILVQLPGRERNACKSALSDLQWEKE